jgi:hypothetical protein
MDEQERMLKKVDMTYFQILSRPSPASSEERQKNISYGRPSLE